MQLLFETFRNYMKLNVLSCLMILFIGIHSAVLAATPETSVAGFFELKESGRVVYNFNPGWRYHKGDAENGESPRLDDSSWRVVSLPHTVELMPAEASGNRNYQGPAWYRKHFVVDRSLENR